LTNTSELEHELTGSNSLRLPAPISQPPYLACHHVVLILVEIQPRSAAGSGIFPRLDTLSFETDESLILSSDMANLHMHSAVRARTWAGSLDSVSQSPYPVTAGPPQPAHFPIPEHYCTPYGRGLETSVTKEPLFLAPATHSKPLPKTGPRNGSHWTG
jgi:hypothetical protein